MKKLLALALALLTTLSLAAADFTQESLATEVGAMKAVLTDIDVEKARRFITTYSHPDELEKRLESGKTVDAMAQAFVDGKKADLLIDLFGQLDVANGVVDDGQRIITCKHKDPERPEKIRFAFVNDAWFLMNR
jgi:hypothetical protein